MKLNRRSLLVGGGAGVGLVVAWAMWPRAYAPGLSAGEGERVFGHYLKIGTDGRVTVAVPQVETGQGVWTALSQILADELGAEWSQVAVEPAPPAPPYDNGLSDLAQGRVTAGATSIRAFAAPLREAGAAARAMLCAAAARRWSVSAAECDTADGFVVHEGKRLGFGELTEAAASEAVPAVPVLREVGAGGLLSRALPRLDGPPKSDGSLRFGADVRLPGLVHASARVGDVAGYDRSVRGVHAGEGWIAAVAATGWAAERALDRAAPGFRAPAGGDTAAIEAALAAALDAEPLPDLRGRLASAEYGMAALPHLALEPPAATARLRDGRLELWAGTQAPDAARRAAAEAAEVGVGDVVIYPLPVGGPDGRALMNETVPVAAALARRIGRPVSVSLHPAHARAIDRSLPPARARMRAQFGPDNSLTAWTGRFAGEPGDFPYAVPSLAVSGTPPELPIRSGYLRGGDELFAAFVRESFVDELARHVGMEPLAFRIAMLGGQPRLARVLSTVAAIGGWDGGGPGSTLGLAAHSAYGSYVALLASATVGADGQVAVERLVCAVDCGRPANIGLVRQQVESGLAAGLAYSSGSVPAFRNGALAEGGARAMGLRGFPPITVEVIPSIAPPSGLSGLSTAVLAPAVANAVAAATGRRLRKLPFDPMSA